MESPYSALVSQHVTDVGREDGRTDGRGGQRAEAKSHARRRCYELWRSRKRKRGEKAMGDKKRFMGGHNRQADQGGRWGGQVSPILRLEKTWVFPRVFPAFGIMD